MLTSFYQTHAEMTLDDAARIIETSDGRLTALRLDFSKATAPIGGVVRKRLADSVVAHAPELDLLALCGLALLPFDRLIGLPRLRALVVDPTLDELARFGTAGNPSAHQLAQLVKKQPALGKLARLLESDSAPREIAHTSDHAGTTNALAFRTFVRALKSSGPQTPDLPIGRVVNWHDIREICSCSIELL